MLTANNKWIDTDILELEKFIKIGSSREVEEEVAKEFKFDFGKNLIYFLILLLEQIHFIPNVNSGVKHHNR